MKKIFFTVHAKDRCYEYGLNFRKLKDLFKTAHKVVPPQRTKLINKIWHRYKRSEYKWSGGVLFTYIVKGNTDIIMTVTPKKREEVEFE